MNALRNIKAPSAALSIRYAPGNGWRIRQGDIKGTTYPALERALDDWNEKATRDARLAIHETFPGVAVDIAPATVPVHSLAGWDDAETIFKDAMRKELPGVILAPWPWEAGGGEGEGSAMVLDGDETLHRRLARLIGVELEPGDFATVTANRFHVAGGSPISRLDPMKAGEGCPVFHGTRPEGGGTPAAARRPDQATIDGILDELRRTPGVKKVRLEKQGAKLGISFEQLNPGHPLAFLPAALDALHRAIANADLQMVEALCMDHRNRCGEFSAMVDRERKNHQEPDYIPEIPREYLNPSIRGVDNDCQDEFCGPCLLESAWGIIANAHGGNWATASQEWQGAASKWRDRFFLFARRSMAEQEAEEAHSRQPLADLLKGSLPTGKDKAPPMPKGLMGLMLLAGLAGALSPDKAGE